VEDPNLCRGSDCNYKILGELSEADLKISGVLEVPFSEGVEVGKRFSPEHSARGGNIVHIFLDDAEPVSVRGGFGVVVVVVVVVVHFKILILIVLGNGRFYFQLGKSIYHCQKEK
jgi:hypothetical protein